MWTCTAGTRASHGRPVGLTVSSMLFSDGEPAEIVALLDPDSELAEAYGGSRRCRVNVLADDQADLADAFAGLSPAPGGPFTLGEWRDDTAGPELVGAAASIDVELVGDPVDSGWSWLTRGRVVGLELSDRALLSRTHGRYGSTG